MFEYSADLRIVLSAEEQAGPVSYDGGVPALLRSVWDEARPSGAPGRVWRDWVLIAVLAPVVVAEGALREDVPWPVLSIALGVGLLPVLLWRRTRPLLMVAIAFGACELAGLLTTGEPPGLNAFAYILLLPYALFRWGSGREAAAGAAIVFTKIWLGVPFDGMRAGDAFGACAIVFAAMALGGAVRYRAGARLRELDQAKLLERERLARDLHDTVAHHVSAIAIRAQAGLATSPDDPRAAEEALRLIETEASRTLAEMRTIVRALRYGQDQPAELAPSPLIADIRRLAGRGRTGPAVDVRFTGDLRDVPPSVASTVFRLAQESVTNARRHARRATRIEVQVAGDDTSVRLRVRDDGESAALRGSPPGYGLVGMIERAGLLGGTCEAGPDPERGWTVTAVLPRTASPR